MCCINRIGSRRSERPRWMPSWSVRVRERKGLRVARGSNSRRACVCVCAGNPALRDRETRGIVRSSKLYYVTQEMVDVMKKRPKHEFGDGRPDVLFSAIDPSGGGAQSEYVILTMAMEAGTPVVRSSARGSGCTCAAQRRSCAPPRPRCGTRGRACRGQSATRPARG